MLYKQIVKTVFGCAIATTLGFYVPEASQAANLTPLDETTANPVFVNRVPTGVSPLTTDTALIAQSVSNSRSLSASGYGRAYAPIDQAAIVLSYALNYYPETSPDENVIVAPSPTAQESDLNTVVDALVGAGIARSAIRVTRDAYSPQSLRVVVRVDSPTGDRISALVDLANATATKDNKFYTNSAGVVYTARDCQAAEDTARQMAITEARNQVAAMASAVGVQTGDLLGGSGSVIWSYSSPSSSSCPTSIDDILNYVGLYGAQAYDPSLSPQVPVDANVSLTYEIR